MERKLIWIFTVLLQLHGIIMLCEKKRTCEECITDSEVCVWCAMNNFNGTRCKSISSYTESWCQDHVQSPESLIEIIKNRNFNSDPGKVTQFKPQKYKLQIRTGEPVDFKFSFKGAKDYPVDIYFLLDASSSMKKVKNATASSSENIYLTMRNMTKNVYLGAGTFIEKNTLPFTIKSSLTYSFRHQLKLTNNFEEFKKTINDSPSGYNYDDPEAGLDALAQVIVCKDTIGWRNESRKIVVFLTDAPYHAAGDGKWAGIVKPYDGKCYTEDGAYTKELEMDYPSVSIINKLAADEEVTIIFAVDSKVEYIYVALSNAISGSKYTTYNNNKIATILEDFYKKITRSLTLKVNMKSEYRKYFQVTFNPNCGDKNKTASKNCDVVIGKEKEFIGTIKLLEYYGTDNIQLDIVAEGIKEKLTLDIEVLKKCDCENKNVYNSTLCHTGGTLQCGICKCNSNRYGEKCVCTSTKGGNINDNSTCIAENSTEECSGHGSCFCGTCQCRRGYEGQYCECNKESCPRDASGALCSDHGECDCGVCKCKQEWSGDDCQCYNVVEPCIGKNGDICNNRGTCVCGLCKCLPRAQWDERTEQDRFCRMKPCPDCHNRQCLTLTSCALCQHKENFDCSEQCDDQITVNVTKTLNFTSDDDTWNECSNVRVDVGCYTSFLYRYDDKRYSMELLVQTTKNCLRSYYLVGGIFLAVFVFIGLATLVAWKLLTETRDRREYERFVKQHAADISAVCNNPIYEAPTTTFQNPAFRKRSVDFRL